MDVIKEGSSQEFGALRDMMQSHLLQMMSIIAPDERDVSDRIAAVLRAAQVGPDYSRTTRRAR